MGIGGTVLRVTWPFEIGSQILELGGGGYYGRFTVKVEDAKDGTKLTSAEPDNSFHDGRGQVSVVLYPKPLGSRSSTTSASGRSSA